MMNTRLILICAASVFTGLAVAACGGSEGEEAATSEESVAASQPESPAATEEETADAPTEDGTGEAEPTETEASETEPQAVEDPGPAAEGAELPAGTAENPPSEVGTFVLQEGEGPANIYVDSESGAYVTVDGQTLGSPYETLVEEIATENAPAGTGSCGLNSGGTSTVCYVRSADGVITLTGDAAEVPVEQLVTFANQSAQAAGVS